MALSQTVRAVRTSTVALLDDEEEQPRLLRSIFKNVHAEGGQCKSIYSWGVSSGMAENMTLFQPTPEGGVPNPQLSQINLFGLIKELSQLTSHEFCTTQFLSKNGARLLQIWENSTKHDERAYFQPTKFGVRASSILSFRISSSGPNK